ncbi:hypothetical protein LguiB_034489 [Lonicera macranthoides]
MVEKSESRIIKAKATNLAAAILSATSPPQISAAITTIESFLHRQAPNQARWFFSITFPTLICKILGFNDSPPHRPRCPTGWIDIITSSTDSDLAARFFSLLSPNGILMSSINAVDRLSLVKYVFSVERLPEWIRFMLQNDRDCRILEDLCPLFKGRVKKDSIKGSGSSFQVQLNVFEYYMFWFAYYPVYRGNSENSDAINVRRSKRFRLENWAYFIPGFSNPRQGKEEKNECNLYIRLLYAYLCTFVPLYDLTAHQPYRSSLLHYSQGYDSSVLEHAEFFVYTLIQFWLVDNDLSPLPIKVSKSFSVNFPFVSVVGEAPPTSGLSEVVNVFVKYLNLSSTALTEGFDHVDSTGSPRWRVSSSVDVAKSRDVMPAYIGLHAASSWNSMFQRILYRFILRTFLFCPVETSIKNASQVVSLWINYIEPWMVSLEDFAELGTNFGALTNNNTKELPQSRSHGYSSSWQGFVLTNYLFYSSLVMHFVGFAHKFLHTDAEVIVQMVSKVLNTLTSSMELIDLVKNVDTVFHSKPSGSSKSVLNSMYRYVPIIREQLQDWEDGLCESDADGSFLHENWNKDLRLFSDGEDGGQQLLQLFVLRAEDVLQAVSGGNLQHLDSIKAQMRSLFGVTIEKRVSSAKTRQP